MESADKTFQVIFDQAAVGMAQIGLDGSWLRVNGRYCQMLGYSEAELLTKTICEITHPDDYDEISAARRQLLEGAISSHSMEKRYIRKDGTIFWGRLNRSLVRDHDNLPKFFIAVVEDITEKVQAERVLRDRERQLVLAQSAGRLELWDRDLRTGVTATSGEFARLHGLTPDELPRSHEEWFQLLHPGDRERVRAEYQESLERGHVWDTEFRVVWPDGSIHWLLAQGQVFRDDAGRPVRLAGINLDITERKRTEEALQISQERLELAQRAGGIGIWDWDAATDESHCSIGFGPLYGRSPGYRTPSFAAWFELVSPQDRVRVREELSNILKRADYYSTEFSVIWPDGTIHWLLGKGQVFRDSRGEPIRMIGVNVDISERKSAEAALRESEERFRIMADTAPVMIWVVGPDKRATFFNKSCTDFTGHTMEHKLGDGWAANLHPEDRDPFLAVFSSSIDARQEFRTVFRLRRADGEYRWVLCTGVPRFVAGGTFAGYVGSCVDITDMKRTQEEALARQKLESLGVLANGIAHDFNNLLGSIMAQAELVKADLVAGLSPDGALEGIKTVAIHGAEIVRELMTYAGQDQAGFFEPVDLSRLTAEMLELLKVSISKHARLKINLERNLPAVLGNAPQIRQVVMNLIINASEAIGDREGVIQVTTSRVPAGDYVRLEVSDNGCGMAEEAKAKIFDPFYTTKFAGRGLGLAVVQGIVHAHGGAIDVVSAPGQGATFQVTLSCSSKSASELVPNAVTASGVEGAGTVLVVEDEEVLRVAVSKALRGRGFSVIEAKDGSVAIELMRNHRDDIDLILLDVTLPGASSEEVFEEATRIWANPKVVLTSAYDRRTVDSFFPGLRVTQFIRKPFGLDDLASTLRNALASPIKFHSEAAQ